MNKTQQRRKELRLKIQNELGINIDKYKNPDLIDKFVSVIAFPQYALPTFLKAVGISFLIFFIGFFIIDLVSFEYIIYAIIGLVLSLILGFLIGTLLLLKRTKNDICEMLKLSVGVVKDALNDLGNFSQNSAQMNKTQASRLLLDGVINVVSIPTIETVVAKKVPLVGNYLSSKIGQQISKASNLIKFSNDTTVLNNSSQATITNVNNKANNSITVVGESINAGVVSAYKTVRFPVMLATVIISIIALVFILLVN